MVFPCGFCWFVDLFSERKGTLDKKRVLLLTLEGACMSFCMNSVSGAGNNVFVCAHSRLALCDSMDCQAPLSMGLSQQEYWVGCHALLQGSSRNPGIKPAYPVLQADSLMLSHSLGKLNSSPSPVFSPGKFYEQRSLVGYNPCGHKSQTQLSD